MMKKIKIFKALSLSSLTLFLSSCGMHSSFYQDFIVRDRSSVRKYNQTDPVFNQYIRSFETAGKKYTQNSNFKVGDIPINFGVIEGNKNVQGICHVYTSGEREIIIRKSWWKNADKASKESLVYHELGHCKLDRDHKEDDLSVPSFKGASIKLSLMNPIIVDSKLFDQYRQGYLQELFQTNHKSLKSTILSSSCPLPPFSCSQENQVAQFQY